MRWLCTWALQKPEIFAFTTHEMDLVVTVIIFSHIFVNFIAKKKYFVVKEMAEISCSHQVLI